MRNNKLRLLIEFIGLDYKKEIIKLIALFLLGVAIGVGIFFLTKQFVFLVVGLGISIIFDYLLFNSYLAKRDQFNKERDEEFINVINYFQTFITNKNNVYQSFSKLMDYSSEWMQEKIQRLLNDIDIDKSVKPFVDFADNFSFSIAKNIMLSIYQMIDEGEDNLHLSQFETLFNQLNQTHQEELKDRKRKSLQTMTSFPMVGAALITVILSISIIAIMGEMINVI